MQKFTHSDLLEINEQEQELKLLLNQKKEDKMYTPKQKTVDNILYYSRALSIRKSENLEYIEMILN
jgi:hypothetical protein